MFGTLFLTQVYKPLASLSMALTMAITSTITGPVSECEKLANEAAAMDPAVTETQIEVMIDLEAISEATGGRFSVDGIPEIPGIYKDGKIDTTAALYTYSDEENAKFALSFGKTLDAGYAVYIDEDGLAITPALLNTVLSFISVVDESGAEYFEVYKEYFADNGFYLNWDAALGLSADDVLMETINEQISLINDIIADITTILTKEDNVAALAKIVKPMFDSMDKYYSQNGTAYTVKLNGVQYIQCSAELMDILYTEEMANNIYDYLLEIIDDIDYIKYFDIIKSLSGDDVFASLSIPEGTTNATIAVLVTTYLESYRADFVESYTSEYTEEASAILDIIASGKTEGLDEETAYVIETIYPFLENSYLEGTIKSENGVITEKTELVIADKSNTYAELAITNGTSNYSGKIASAAEIVPFDKRVEFEEMDNKIGFKFANEKGVHSVNIQWNAIMTPQDAAPELYSPSFDVNYKSSMIESIKNDPAFATLTEAEKELILGMYTDTDYEFKYCPSTAHLIDGSVYLPLRQIMENCGYEVSWDGEARKAYVTIDGNKIEMTGVIVNDRTYVKIRDFEKLGATVEYEETMYREDAYNDFNKYCYVTITFAE